MEVMGEPEWPEGEAPDGNGKPAKGIPMELLLAAAGVTAVGLMTGAFLLHYLLGAL